MSEIFEFKNNIDLESQILWQYANAANLNSLLTQKQNWYLNYHNNFWKNWATDVLNITTANDFGLSIWGLLLQVSRTYNINGVMTTLDTEQYRLLLRGRLLYLRTSASVPEINQYLHLLFEKEGRAYVRDNLDMSMVYVFEFTPTLSDIVVLLNTNVLPRPAGVKYKIYVLPDNDIFGFSESDWVGFDQAPFWSGNDLAQ